MHFAFQFSWDRSIYEIKQKLNAIKKWQWRVRDSAWYQDFLQCRPKEGLRICIYSENPPQGRSYHCHVEIVPASVTERDSVEQVLLEFLEHLEVRKRHARLDWQFHKCESGRKSWRHKKNGKNASVEWETVSVMNIPVPAEFLYEIFVIKPEPEFFHRGLRSLLTQGEETALVITLVLTTLVPGKFVLTSNGICWGKFPANLNWAVEVFAETEEGRNSTGRSESSICKVQVCPAIAAWLTVRQNWHAAYWKGWEIPEFVHWIYVKFKWVICNHAEVFRNQIIGWRNWMTGIA